MSSIGLSISLLSASPSAKRHNWSPDALPAAIRSSASPSSLAKIPAYSLPSEMIIAPVRSEEHTSELQSLMRISYAVFCLKKKQQQDVHRTVKIDAEKTVTPRANH